MDVLLQAIGVVSNERKAPVDDYWGAIISTIQLDAACLDADALEGITEFSHVEVIFYMNLVVPEKVVRGARYPRNDTSLPKFGILAQRGKNRVNQLGVSFAKVLSFDGLCLTVSGLDAIDGTPVLDIKPCFKEFLPQEAIRQPAWSVNLMENYYKS
jgi:tRNA (adenine37-N6)-methyltransferase